MGLIRHEEASRKNNRIHGHRLSKLNRKYKNVEMTGGNRNS